MFDALQIAATGMHAQQLHVDTIANNLTNVNTAGFKKARVSFQDLVTRDVEGAVQLAAAGTGTLETAQRLGAGVGVARVGKLFDAGDVRKTDSAYDVAIAGDGFFELTMSDGSRTYTRGGPLKVNADGMLATQAGHVLKPGIAIPDNAQALTITQDGKVFVRVPNQGSAVEVGQIEMVRFTNPGGLNAVGDGLYRSAEASGEPIAGRAGEDAMGSVQQGFLEGSNVKLVEEMVNLMVAQRAYEASVKVVQASDEMLGLVNSLRK